MSWFLISIKARFQKCDSTRIVDIFGEKVVKSWPEFYADYDGIKNFWKFWDFDQNNPVLKFDTFFAIIPTCLDNNVPKFGVHGSFLTLNRIKVLQNLGVKYESYQSGIFLGTLS